MGHSQGTAQMFAALSQNTKWMRERIQLFIAVAPVARVGKANGEHIKSFSNNKLLLACVEKFGPELMPEPNVDNNLKKTFLKITNFDDIGLG